jgi:hypothetical protein
MGVSMRMKLSSRLKPESIFQVSKAVEVKMDYSRHPASAVRVPHPMEPDAGLE